MFTKKQREKQQTIHGEGAGEASRGGEDWSRAVCSPVCAVMAGSSPPSALGFLPADFPRLLSMGFV